MNWKILLLLAVAGAGAYYHYKGNPFWSTTSPAQQAVEQGKTETWNIKQKPTQQKSVN